jgi:hypothetical protein
MAALKGKVRVEFGNIPEVMFQKSIMNMKKRTPLMAGVEGQHLYLIVLPVIVSTKSSHQS